MIDRIGPYSVTRELGRGGMGVVYLARDARLDRDVAIKSIPEHLASEPARLERFEREARTLASLNHPNIAGIHGVEEQDGARYLVLEYVEGVSLAEMLDAGPIPIADAIEYARQIAAGIEAAHESGVVHRDLKPANIMITSEGSVKILDFGLARAEDGSSSYSGLDRPTMTTPLPQHSPTIEGAILGTAAYMSPEQARGRRVDKRTDIWSFAVVLYEMLAGLSPFHGETATDSIGAVLHKDLDLALLPKETPASVRRVLRRCLVRDPAMRYRDIGDVRVELMAGSADEHESPIARGVSLSVLAAFALVAICVAAGAFFYARTLTPQPEPKQQLKFVVDLLSGSDGYVHGASRQFSLSRDGSMLVVSGELDGKNGLWVRRLDEQAPRLLPGTERAFMPVFSPSGNWIAYFADGALMRVPTVGGSPQTLAPGTNAARGVAWISETRLAYTPNTTSPVMTVDIGGGEPAAITNLLPESESVSYRSHRWPVIDPTNRYVVFTAQLAGESFTESSISAVNLETGLVTELVDSGGAFPIVLPSGELLYNSAGTIYRVGMDWDGREPVTVGSPDPVLFNVVYAGLNGSTQISVADNGSLLYMVGEDSVDIQSLITWLDLSTGES
ncbi:MAG TPA: protein kinase, partial [Gammaproteobacteria bacterium]|nr:protein kinase [Gammaproteobacteria bacterium]